MHSKSIFLIPALLLLGASAHPTAESPAPGSEVDTRNLHTLYNDYHTPTSFLARLFSKQGPLVPHQVGQVSTKHTTEPHHPIPITFSLSPATCKPLAHEISCLVNDLSNHVLASNPTGVIPAPGCHDKETVVEESVSMVMGGREYRATIEMSVKGALDKEQFGDLMKMFAQTVEQMEEARGEKGMGALLLASRFQDVPVQAKWVFYEVVGGSAVRCGWEGN